MCQVSAHKTDAGSCSSGGGPSASHAALRAPAGRQAASQLALDPQGCQGVVAGIELGTVSVTPLSQPVFPAVVQLGACCQDCAFHAMQRQCARLAVLQRCGV